MSTTVRCLVNASTFRGVGLADLVVGGVTPDPDPNPGAPTVYAGALPLGLTFYEPPTTAVMYVATNGNDANAGTAASPKRTLAAATSAAPSGTTIVVRAGEYSEGITTASGKVLTIQAYPGEVVWFDGSRLATSWTSNGNGTWSTAYTKDFPRFGVSGYPGQPFRNYPDQCWVNGAALAQIEDGATPAAGQFSVNQTLNTLTIGQNPAGASVRVSDLTTFLIASGVVNLRGIGVRRYSPTAVEGINAMVFYGGTSAGTTIENCLFQDSSMAALAWSKIGFTVQRNTFQDTGYSGVMVTKADGFDFSLNLIRRHNKGGWTGTPATAGIKITRSDSFSVYQNYIDDPIFDCPQIWLDVSNTRFKIYANRVIGGEGLNIELSDGGKYGGVQYYSYVAGNDALRAGNLGSGNVRYWNNRWSGYGTGLSARQDRGLNTGAGDNRTPEECPWLVRGLESVNNDFGMPNPSGLQIQLIARDDVPKLTLGLDMFDRIAGNKFYTAPPGSMAQMGRADGTRQSFNTPEALAAAPATVGNNAVVGVNRQSGAAPTSADHAAAIGLTAPVSAMLGLPVGTKLVGPNEALLPSPRPDEGWDVIVPMIQSNMRGAATDYVAADQYPAGVFMWDHASGQIVTAKEAQSNWDNFNGMGASNTFIKDWVQNRLAAGRKVLIVNTTRGGTGFSTPSSNSFGNGFHWRHDLADDANNLALRARDTIHAALAAAGPNARIVAFLANHGSTDGTNNLSKATFKAYLQSWITWIRGQLNASNVPYLMMQMRPSLIAAETRHRNIADAQAETAAELPLVGYALSPNGAEFNKNDAVHFNAAGVRVIGHNLYAKYGDLIN